MVRSVWVHRLQLITGLVIDETLLESVDVTKGLNPDGAIVINTTKSVEEVKPFLKGYTGGIYTIDARRISEEALGKYFPNSPMLAAIVAISKVMTKEDFFREMEASYKHKFAKKPEVVEGNMKALHMAYEEVE